MCSKGAFPEILQAIILFCENPPIIFPILLACRDCAPLSCSVSSLNGGAPNALGAETCAATKDQKTVERRFGLSASRPLDWNSKMRLYCTMLRLLLKRGHDSWEHFSKGYGQPCCSW